jgi:hypothetical protein
MIEWECDCDSFEDFECMDCSLCTLCNTEYYMVTDEIWNREAETGMLCIGCLEARRGKLLTKDDFTDCPLNHDNKLFGSPRLQDRLTKVTASATI